MSFRFRLKIYRKNVRKSILAITDAVMHRIRHTPSRKYCAYYVRMKCGKLRRHARYLFEDAWFRMRKWSRHTEAILFGALILLAAAMLLSSGGESMLTSLMALLILMLTVVIYSQLKLQKRMIRQYVPVIENVRIRKCQLYSDTVRMLNLFSAPDKLNEIRKVVNVKIGYDIVNDSFSPISVEGVSLSLRLKGGTVKDLPSSVSILDVEPKRTNGTEVGFRLEEPVSFEEIEWLELEIKGNCKKKVRVKPHLYVNISTRDDKPRSIFEPIEKFAKRQEFADGGIRLLEQKPRKK